jgi:hypothetical protein
VILSDFLVDPAPLQTPLAFLRARRHEVVLLRVLDPEEKNFQPNKPVLIREIESGQERFIDPASVHATYRNRFEAHRNSLGSVLAPLGIPLVEFLSTDPMEQVLGKFLSHREHPRSGALSP